MSDAAMIRHGLIIRPGDTLVVCVSPDTPIDHVVSLKHQVKEALPMLAGVVVIQATQIAAVQSPVVVDEPVIDPDCRDEKHGSCMGGPCGCRTIGRHSVRHANDPASWSNP
jgi:hypothetical protein